MKKKFLTTGFLALIIFSSPSATAGLVDLFKTYISKFTGKGTEKNNKEISKEGKKSDSSLKDLGKKIIISPALLKPLIKSSLCLCFNEKQTPQLIKLVQNSPDYLTFLQTLINQLEKDSDHTLTSEIVQGVKNLKIFLEENPEKNPLIALFIHPRLGKDKLLPEKDVQKFLGKYFPLIGDSPNEKKRLLLLEGLKKGPREIKKLQETSPKKDASKEQETSMLHTLYETISENINSQKKEEEK